MKTTNRLSLLTATVCALAFTFATVSYADKNMEIVARQKKAAAAATAVQPAAHKCPSCTDSVVSVVDKGTKGPNYQVSKLVRHNCTACETKIVAEGAGKARHEVAVHSCGMAEQSACCVKN